MTRERVDRDEDPVEIAATVVYDEEQRRWTATAIAPTPSGNKRFSAPGVSTTKAAHQLAQLIKGASDVPFQLAPKIRVPASKKERHEEFVRRLKAFRKEKAWIETERVALAREFERDNLIPVRSIAPMLGMSQQRLGKLLAKHEFGLAAAAAAASKPRKARPETSDEVELDEDDE